MADRIAVVTGASGLIGRTLVTSLIGRGFEVRRLVRRSPRSPGEWEWNPAAGAINLRALDGVTHVVNLAGENIGHRWTAGRLARIRTSRINGTAALARAIVAADVAPSVWVNASAVGFYGDRGDEVLDESAGPGGGILAEICREWEGATAPVEGRGTRVVHLRSGVVLDPEGGALARMLLPFRFGLGGRIGSGRQWMSWITLDDEVRAIVHALESPRLRGPVNSTAPEPITNQELTDALASALGRWAVFPVPAFVLELIFGRMARETLLVSQRAVPRALLADGFSFTAPTIARALATILR
jgi:uncharacterized protein (TIGR01777 family)